MNRQLWLDSMEEQLRDWKMKTVIVHQGGQLAAEWYEQGKDSLGALYSCTKSVLSCLIGIALDEKLIESVEQPISDYVDHPAFGGEGSKLGDIRIKHLLTMTPGFEWPDFDKPYWTLRGSPDPIAYVLERPLIHSPGSAFTYNSGGSHLLSAILTRAAGSSAMEYARTRLFEPLHFRRARWTERRGVNEGGTGMSLYARDLAKLGQLYLQGGCWNGRQLVSSEWTRQSTRTHHRGLLHYEPPIYGEYGYHWWRTPASFNGLTDCYFAFGHGGQYLLVAPEYELVVVIRKEATKRNDAERSRRLLFDHLLPRFKPSVQSAQA